MKAQQKIFFSFLGLACLLLSACAETVATHGQIVKARHVNMIREGVHTKRDVQRLLGSPSTTGTFNNARWYYMTSTTSTKPLNPNVLQGRTVWVIDFDKEGVVSHVSQKTQDDGKQVEPDAAATKTHGQSKGIFEQLIDNVGAQF